MKMAARTSVINLETKNIIVMMRIEMSDVIAHLTVGHEMTNIFPMARIMIDRIQDVVTANENETEIKSGTETMDVIVTTEIDIIDQRTMNEVK